jgi:HEAT repeat protein
MGRPRIQTIALVGAGAISSSAIFCFFLVTFLPEPFGEEGTAVPPPEVSTPPQDQPMAMGVPYPAPDPFERAVRELSNPDLPLTLRREAAFRLAAFGTDEAMMELLLAAASATPFLKAAIADALAEFAHPEARRFLQSLLNDESAMVARAALRALGRLDDPDSLRRVAEVLLDPNRAVGLRTEAALVLGRSDHPDALPILLHASHAALEDDETEPVFHHVLEALAQRSFGEVEGFVSRYMLAEGLASESRAAVLEALGGGGGTAAFLVNFLRDADPEVRSAAAWSLTITPDAHPYAAEIVGCLSGEADAGVRANLYRALQGQVGVDGQSLVQILSLEGNGAARLAGYDLLASLVSGGASVEVVDYFNYRAVPELREAALQGSNLQRKLSAIIALQRAKTKEARQALWEIANSSRDGRVQQAALAGTHASPGAFSGSD